MIREVQSDSREAHAARYGQVEQCVHLGTFPSTRLRRPPKIFYDDVQKKYLCVDCKEKKKAGSV